MTAFHKDALPRGYELAEYTIEAVLGHGGFGVTYLARDSQLGTQVAIKEYLPHQFAHRDSATGIVPNTEGETVATYRVGLREFLREGQSLARFKHHNIVRVLRFLETNGTAYMVMEYEKGQSLSQYLRNEGPYLDQAALLRVFLPILNGLYAVHEAGMLHLDIKPENIYLREDDSPMLIDFGSARQALLGPGHNQAIALTPGYAPIEQYPDGGKQGPWTDVYAMGASLYRCISGKRPIASPERYQAILKYEPDPLAPAIDVGQGRYPAYVLESIDWALRVHASERPQSARALQDALMGRGQTIRRAHAPTPAVFKASKPVTTVSVPPRAAAHGSRHRARARRRSPLRWFAAMAVLGALAAGVLVYGSALQTYFPTIIDYVRQLSRDRVSPPRQRLTASTVPSSASTAVGAHALPEPQVKRAPEKPVETAKVPVVMSAAGVDGSKVAPAVPGGSKVTLPDHLVRTLSGHVDWVHALAFSPDGKTLVSGSYDTTIRVWAVSTGALRAVLRGHERPVNSLAYSTDGKWIASAGDDATVRLWDAASGKPRSILPGPSYPVYSIAFSPDSSLLAAGGKDRTVFVWKLADKSLLYTLEGHQDDVLAVAFSPDGSLLASAGVDKDIRLWSMSDGNEFTTLSGHKDVVLALAFSPDGRWLASGSSQDTIKLWDVHKLALVRSFDSVRYSVLTLAFSPDSQWVAAGGTDTSVTVWRVETGNVAEYLEGHSDYVHALAFSPDGTLLASASRDHTIKLWGVH